MKKINIMKYIETVEKYPSTLIIINWDRLKLIKEQIERNKSYKRKLFVKKL
ncbi:TPA: hypothetical protein ACSVPQ_002466 [Clostridioides difficile]|uniref:hypothetical protein n=1 Tax=Clostridioides difficile TaxID=1496 RepID=UPI001304217E|nr:hypothetical protein [Clostridioides difficile]MBH7167702.1 hypothetical protein [Clostridioides difficile]MBY1346211.1 hypothetical protein [Clostridioides difficile]MCW0912231.1 hypothetical protein [Clostridioides difficile]MDI7828050.1 hypothetical protein [Clostridioides difficile]HBE8718211.1 hypothetical protein [Clostridioides difficile]